MSRAVGPRQAPQSAQPYRPDRCPRCGSPYLSEDCDGWGCWCGWHNWHYASEHQTWYEARMRAPRERACDES